MGTRWHGNARGFGKRVAPSVYHVDWDNENDASIVFINPRDALAHEFPPPLATLISPSILLSLYPVRIPRSTRAPARLTPSSFRALSPTIIDSRA